MPRVFIGRTHDLYGKSLWELLCNLKDFGVGRVVKRTKFNQRYPERSWYRIINVQPEMDEENRCGSVTVRRVFRGVETPRDVTLSRTTALTDYQLELERLEDANASAEMPAIYRNQWNYNIQGRTEGGAASSGSAAS
ncbi:hypothetical protein FJT64_015287 [Amphibalanus amphitrite]|uniref:28S ribosomal protein S34, mitochondrial n=1 Tax=Amphibalanus amphitrite TaxID=1232801 RepID=A0A6A4X4W2_AMPAM|nr:hypothetical protein FJT64_015287 [Amphibalanus amphitrite]KAF0314266.1 hypothetical protein FJT64_015287 [Amphibalanus amphitrite]